MQSLIDRMIEIIEPFEGHIEGDDARKIVTALCETHLIAPKITFDGEKNMVTTKSEYDRLYHENNVLWAIFKTCPGCKNLVPGVVYGCDIQKHIDLSGVCNQREEASTDGR